MTISKYLGLAFSKLNSIVGWLSNIATMLLLFFGGKIFPETIPSLFLGIMLFLVSLIFCGWRVWIDQIKLNAQLNADLDEIRSTIPIFTIVRAQIRKFSVRPLIEELQKELAALKPEPVIIPKKEKGSNMTSAGFLLGPSATSSFLTATKSFQNSLNQFAGISKSIGYETGEEKYKRLRKHLGQLMSYEAVLQNKYQIHLTFTSTLSAKNIEFEVSSKTATLSLGDNDITENIPQSHEPSANYFSPYSDSARLGRYHTGSTRSYFNRGVAYSGTIPQVNAQSPRRLFDEDLYATTNEDSIQLIVSVTSEGQREPQKIPLEIITKGVIVKEISEH